MYAALGNQVTNTEHDDANFTGPVLDSSPYKMRGVFNKYYSTSYYSYNSSHGRKVFDLHNPVSTYNESVSVPNRGVFFDNLQNATYSVFIYDRQSGT